MVRHNPGIMKKGPTKHSKEVIQSAISKFENGARLSAIARELGVEKTTVKYWLDHASRFAAESAGSPVTSRIQSRLTKEAWDLIFMSLKEIKRKLPEANIKDLVSLLGELFDRQAQFGKALGSNAVPEKVLERSEELQVTVKRFLAGKADSGSSESLSADSPQQVPSQEVTEAEIAPEEQKPEGNDAE